MAQRCSRWLALDLFLSLANQVLDNRIGLTLTYLKLKLERHRQKFLRYCRGLILVQCEMPLIVLSANRL